MKSGDVVKITSGPLRGKLARLRSKIAYHDEKNPRDRGAWAAFVNDEIEMVYAREIEPTVKLKRRKTDG